MAFDLVIRGGTVIDGSGVPGRRADVGVTGDRIAVLGDLSRVADADVATVIDAAGLVVAPGFVDPHGHSDLSALVDGAHASHLHQGYTTQLSGNCGASFAPLTPSARAMLDPEMAAFGVDPDWTTFAGYLDAIECRPLGINVAFLVGHGTVRAAVIGAEAREPTPAELKAMVGHVEQAIEAGAVGVSTGLIYAPGLHARPEEVAAVVAAAVRRGALYATHMRNEARDVVAAIDEALATARAAERLAGRPARLQVSHLKAAAAAMFGQGLALVARLEAARAGGLDVATDQYPYAAAQTNLSTVLPPEVLALDPDDAVALLRDPSARRRILELQARGISGWEHLTQDPGWAGIVVGSSTTRPSWNGRSLADIAGTEGGDPADLALDVLADERLATECVIHCMDERDVDAIAAVPWIAVCTDATARRPEHPILGAGVTHPRAYGSTARVLGRFVRERGLLTLETAVAKLTSVPADRLGLRDRGLVREGLAADLVCFDAATVVDVGTYDAPARYPTGIPHVILNGAVVIRDGRETGERPGRVLRFAH